MDITAEKQHISTPWRPHQVSVKTAVLASVAGLMIGVPLLALMGISFVATMTLLLVTMPLFILFFPVLFGAACVFGLVMLGLAAAGTMAVAGVSAAAWAIRSSASGRVPGKLMGDVEGGRETGKDWAGYIQQKPYLYRENAIINKA